MKPICLIPARSGSKGLKNKNMLYLDEKPMIFHTINSALESGCFEKKDIFVSTDSVFYKEICETLGISVILRSEELSTDYATTFDVNRDFLKNFDDEQIFVLLQATSPFRSGKNIREAMNIFLNEDCENVVSLSPVDKSPSLFTTIDDCGFAKDICGIDKGYRRQNHKKLFCPNGAIFISSKSVYLKNESYFTEKTKAYIMEKENSLDIDDVFDFKSAMGRIYFDYKYREFKNKEYYREQYKILDKNRNFENIILGDSRLLDFKLENFDNFSLGGVTLDTTLENLDIILRENTKKIILSLGVNDLICKYSLENIRKNFNLFVDKILDKKIDLVLTTVVYTLFRDSVSNEDIKTLNEFIFELSNKKNIKLIELNNDISKDFNLKYVYTNDGLHFNKEGQKIINGIILENF